MIKEIIENVRGVVKEVFDFTTESDFCQKVNRLLTGNMKIIVQNEKTGWNSTPLAYSNGNKVFLSFKKIFDQCGGDEVKFITAIKSLDYHELAHVLFTNIDYKRDVFDQSMLYTKKVDLIPEVTKLTGYERSRLKFYLNVLEDAKIENLMITQYPNIKKYYVHNVLKFIVSDAEKSKESKQTRPVQIVQTEVLALKSWLLLVGRYFLSRKLVRAHEGEASKQLTPSEVKIVKKLFAEYSTIIDVKKQVLIGIKLMKIIDKKVNNQQLQGFGCENSTHRKKAGTGQHEKAVEVLKEALKEINKEDKAQEKLEEQKTEDDADKQSESEQSNKTGDKNEKEEKKSESEPSRDSVESEKPNVQKEPPSEAQNGSSVGEDNAESVADEINQELHKVEETIKVEVNADLNVLRKNGNFAGRDNANCAELNSSSFNPSTENKIVSLRVKQLLKRLRNGLEARYEKGQKVGRLDMKQVMNSKGRSNRVFKKYLPCRLGKSKMGVTFLLDSSGSMQEGDFQMSLECVWSLNNALSQCGDKTMILEYSSLHKVLKGFHSNNADLRRHFESGTSPTRCLEQAYKSIVTLKRSDNVKNNICFILTDGHWNDTINSDDVICKMKKAGVFTVLIFADVGQHRENNKYDLWKSHPVDESFRITNFKEVEGVCRKVIEKVQLRLKGGRGK